MIREAASVPKRPKLWGVTILTSLDEKDLERMGIIRTVQDQAIALAKGAAEAGLDGVISSVREASAIKKACGKAFHVVTPGIRLAKADDDQKRVETPLKSITEGADFFVMGRPVIRIDRASGEDRAGHLRFVKGKINDSGRRRSPAF